MISHYRVEGYIEPLDGDGWKKYSKKERPDEPDTLFLVQDPKHSIPSIPGYERDVRQRVKGFNFADQLGVYEE